MSTRKYASEYEKLKKRKKEEKLIESQKGSIDKLYKKIRFISKYMHCLQDFTNNTCYSSFYRKKFFKIKINKIISKIENFPKKIMWVNYIID